VRRQNRAFPSFLPIGPEDPAAAKETTMDAFLRIRQQLLAIADRLSWLPPTLARLAIGVVFVGTGWGKLQNLEKITGFFTELGIPAPGFNAVLVSSAELVCGAVILIGLLTRLASIPLMVVMVVAIATAKRADIGGVPDLLGFLETLYVVLLSWLATAGPGPLSIDRFLVRALGSAAAKRSNPAAAPAPVHQEAVQAFTGTASKKQ
jgi:putative oxidoreductase